MECKGQFLQELVATLLVLIETLWNVKEYLMPFFLQYVYVLIETLWNVKQHHLRQSIFNVRVLIETLWNVKDNRFTNLRAKDSCFNRNIVECKGTLRASVRRCPRRVLIETLWNVKGQMTRTVLSGLPF